jgi:hypothetical protein
MSDPAKLPIAMKGSLPDLAQGHMSGNVFEQRDDLTRDNYAALDFSRWLKPPSKYLYRGTVADWKVDAEPELGGSRPGRSRPQMPPNSFSFGRGRRFAAMRWIGEWSRMFGVATAG